MREAETAALRRQTLIRAIGLTAVGIGHCPRCHQYTKVFAWRSAKRLRIDGIPASAYARAALLTF